MNLSFCDNVAFELMATQMPRAVHWDHDPMEYIDIWNVEIVSEIDRGCKTAVPHDFVQILRKVLI